LPEWLSTGREPGGGGDAFFAALVSLAPTGRARIHLSHPRLLKGTGDDIELEEGDDLFLPPKAGTVDVTGAVRRLPEFSGTSPFLGQDPS